MWFGCQQAALELGMLCTICIQSQPFSAASCGGRMQPGCSDCPVASSVQAWTYDSAVPHPV